MIQSLTKTLAKVMAAALAVCLLSTEVFACPPRVAAEPKSHEEWMFELEDGLTQVFSGYVLGTLTDNGLALVDAEGILAQMAQDAATCWYHDVLDRQESRNVEVLAVSKRDYLVLYESRREYRDSLAGCVVASWINVGLDPTGLK